MAHWWCCVLSKLTTTKHTHKVIIAIRTVRLNAAYDAVKFAK